MRNMDKLLYNDTLTDIKRLDNAYECGIVTIIEFVERAHVMIVAYDDDRKFDQNSDREAVHTYVKKLHKEIAKAINRV